MWRLSAGALIWHLPPTNQQKNKNKTFFCRVVKKIDTLRSDSCLQAALSNKQTYHTSCQVTNKLTHIYWAISDIQDQFFVSMKYVKNTDVEIDITSHSHITSWQSQFQKTRFSKSGKTPYNTTTVCGLRGHIFASLILKALV